MNFREGMRRVGVVSGFAGAITGSLFSYFLIISTRDSRASAERFNALVKSNAIVNLMKPDLSTTDKASSGHIMPSGYTPYSGDFALPSNQDRIKSVNFADGEISSIQLMDGQTRYRSTPEPFYMYFLELTLPVISFIVPWSLIKLCVWVVTGFAAKT
jgi:hypothetical protein